MCFDNEDGYPEMTTEGISTARKAHKCSECRGLITKGEDYEWFSGKFDGEFFRLKLCRRCCYDRNRVVEHELAEGCSWSDSWPPIGSGEIAMYLEERELGRTAPVDVPESFKVGDQPKRPEKVEGHTP